MAEMRWCLINVHVSWGVLGGIWKGNPQAHFEPWFCHPDIEAVVPELHHLEEKNISLASPASAPPQGSSGGVEPIFEPPPSRENSMILLHLRCSYFTMEVYKFYANTLILFDNLKCSCWKGIMYSVISLRLREVKTRCPPRIWMSVNFSYPIIVSLFFYIIWTVLMPAITSANCQFLILLLFK